MSYFEDQNSAFPHLNLSEVVPRQMGKMRYTRQIAVAKPPLSPKNMRKQYEFATYYLHWEKED